MDEGWGRQVGGQGTGDRENGIRDKQTVGSLARTVGSLAQTVGSLFWAVGSLAQTVGSLGRLGIRYRGRGTGREGDRGRGIGEEGQEMGIGDERQGMGGTGDWGRGC